MNKDKTAVIKTELKLKIGTPENLQSVVKHVVNKRICNSTDI